MTIKFVLMVNKQGQTRMASYYEWLPIPERVALETEIIRRCLLRTEYQCSFLEYRGYKVIYRRYASLFFVVAVDGEEEVRVQSHPNLSLPAPLTNAPCVCPLPLAPNPNPNPRTSWPSSSSSTR